MDVLEHSREQLVHRIAAELDKPSVYMGGPSLPSKRKAARIVDLLPDYAGAVGAIEKACDTIMPRDGSTVDGATIAAACEELWLAVHPKRGR